MLLYASPFQRGKVSSFFVGEEKEGKRNIEKEEDGDDDDDTRKGSSFLSVELPRGWSIEGPSAYIYHCHIYTMLKIGSCQVVKVADVLELNVFSSSVWSTPTALQTSHGVDQW